MDKAGCRKFTMEAKCSKTFLMVSRLRVSVLIVQSTLWTNFSSNRQVNISYQRSFFKHECHGRKDVWSEPFSHWGTKFRRSQFVPQLFSAANIDGFFFFHHRRNSQ